MATLPVKSLKESTGSARIPVKVSCCDPGMPTALVRSPSPGSQCSTLSFCFCFLQSVDLIKSNVKGRPTSWMMELSFHFNIWAGTSGCWVPLETQCCWALAIVFTGARSWFPLQRGRPAHSQESWGVSTTVREKPWEKNANYIFWPCCVRDGITHISHYSRSFPRAWIASGQGEMSGAFIVAAWLSYRMKYIPCNAFGQIQWFLAAFLPVICLL